MQQMNPQVLAAIIAMMQQEQGGGQAQPPPQSNPMPIDGRGYDPVGTAIAGGMTGGLGGALGGPVASAAGMGAGGLAGLLYEYMTKGPGSEFGKNRKAYNNEYSGY